MRILDTDRTLVKQRCAVHANICFIFKFKLCKENHVICFDQCNLEKFVTIVVTDTDDHTNIVNLNK